MAVNAHTHHPDNLLRDIRAAIKAGQVPGWAVDGDAIAPTNAALAGRARLRASTSLSTLLLGVEVIDREAPRDELLAMVEGRMVQMLGTHFRWRLQLITISSNVDDRFHEGLE